MVAKIYPTIHSCRKCPYNTGRTCSEAEQRIEDHDVIPLFCPLADHPAQTIVRLEATLDSLRNSKNWGLTSVLMDYIAAKLGLTLSAENQFLTIPFIDSSDKKERSVLLRFDTLQEFDPKQGKIPFFFEDRVWVLQLETKLPVLKEPVPDHPELYINHELTVVR